MRALYRHLGWISIWLPGESDANNRILQIQEEITKAQSYLETAMREREVVVDYKKLLFEKGKMQLEPVALKAFDNLGFATTPSEVILGTNFEIDGRTTVGSSPGILEVKGSKKQIPLDEFAPLPSKLLADYQSTGKPSKGILLGNGLSEEMPSARLGNRVFSPHVLEAARRNSVALVNSVELYWLITGVISGGVTDLSAIRELILTTNGYVDLRPHCSRSPFVSAPSG